MSDSPGGNLGCLVIPARTCGFSSTQGIGYGESGYSGSDSSLGP